MLTAFSMGDRLCDELEGVFLNLVCVRELELDP